jgi:hypothetical protein
MTELSDLHDFALNAASVTVWAFKKSQPPGKPPKYTGRWVGTDHALDDALKAAADTARLGITEVLEYALLAQNNEGSALSIGLDETFAPLIVAQCADPTPAKQVKKLRQIENSAFYIVKFIVGETALYGARKADDSWKSKKSKGTISVIFSNEGLTLSEDKKFNISRYFDMFVLGDKVFVTNKGNFESLLSYKQAHIDDFGILQGDKEFSSLFSSLNEIIAYVGENKIQLRRASAIKMKAHYKNSEFMKRLHDHYKSMGLQISFDDEGRIVPSVESCRDIFQALLDHRLDSRLSQNLYDVENTADVRI